MMLHEAKQEAIDPSFVIFVDSSWGNCNDQHSTGCYMVLLQGGSVDHNSFVPDPITLSSIEAQVNAATVGIMSEAHTRMIFMEVPYMNPDRPYTIPVFSDSAAAIAISKNDKR
jgi:hypothetical protein